MLKLRQRGLCFTVLAVFLLQPVGAYAQQAPTEKNIGVVTTLQGQATVGRQPLPQPLPLHFNDDVFFRDRITTQERSTVRLLLGGKGTLTIREQSQVTLDESVTPEGTRRSVVGLLVGKIGAAIARSLMRPGEVIEIQTPNAVAAVRGTVLIAEYVAPQGHAARAKPVLLASSAPGPLLAQAPAAGGQSNFYVVSGEVTITPQGQSPVTVGAMQAVSVTSTATGTQVGAVQNVTPSQINDAAQGLQTGKSHLGEADTSSTAQVQMQVAAALADAIVGATTPTQTTTQPPAPPTDNTVAPVQPESPTTPTSTENSLPAGSLLDLTNVTLGIAEGSSLATFNAGTANVITPIQISGGGTAVVTAPLLPVTGDTITHEGPITTLESGAGIVGANTDTTTPLVSMKATELTNTGGPVFTLSGDAALTTFGPLLSLDAGANVKLAGILALGDQSAVAMGPASAIVIPSGTSLELTAPGFSLTGNSQLSTFAGAEGSGHLVSVSDGTLILDSPLLSLPNGTPTASIAGDLLHVASTVTGPSSGSVVDVSAGSLTVAGDLVHLGAGSTLTLSGPVLSVSGGEVTVGNVLNLGAPLTTPSGPPLLQVTEGSLSTTGSLVTLAANLTLGGALLAQSGGEVTTGADALAVGSQTLTSGTAPVFDLTGGSLTTTTNDSPPDSHLVSVSGGTLTLGGPLLHLAMGPSEQTPTVNISGDLLHVASTVTGPPSGSLVSVEAGSLTVAGNLLNLAADSTLTLNGPVLTVSGGEVAVGNVLNVGAPLTTPSGQPLLQVTNGSLSTTGSLATLGANLTLQGAFLAQSGGAVTTGADALAVGSHTLTSGADPVFDLTGGTLSTTNGSNLVSLNGGTANLGGPLLSLSGGTPTVNIAGDVLHVASAVTGPASGPLVSLAAGSLTAAGDLVSVGAGSTMTLGGQLLTAASGNLKTGGGLLSVKGQLTGSGTLPFIHLDGTTVSPGGFGSVTTYSENPPGTVPVDGLSFKGVTYGYAVSGASSTDATFGGSGPGNTRFVQDPSLEGGASGILSLNFANKPTFIQFGLARDAFSPLTPGASVLLKSDGSTLGTFDLNTTLLTSFSESLFVYSGTPASSADITFPSSDVASRFALDNLAIFDGGLISVEGPGASLSVAGPLLQAANLTLTSSPPLLSLSGGASLTAGGPFLDLTDTTLNLSTVALLTGGSTLANTAGPVFRITGGALTADSLARTDGAGNAFNLMGSLLDLTNTSVTLRVLGVEPAGSTDTFTQTLAPGEPAIRMANSNLTLTGSDESLVSFGEDTGPPISQGGVALIASNTSGTQKTISLAGPLLELGGVTLTDPNSQIQLSNMTVTQTGSNSLIEVSGPSVSVQGPLVSSDTSAITASGLLHVGDGSLVSQTPSPAFDLTGGSLTIEGGGPAIAVNSSATFGGSLFQATNTSLAFEGPFLSLSSETSSLTVGGDVLNLATSTVTGPASGPLVDVSAGSLTASGDLLDLGTGSTLTLSGSLLTVSGGEVAVGTGVDLQAPLTTPNGQPLFDVSGGKVTTTGSLATLGADLILHGAFLAQSGGAVITGAGALAVGASTLSSGETPVFALTGGSLTTTTNDSPPDSHLVSVSGGTLTLGGPLLSLAMGSSEQTPTVNISGDVLHVASTVTGPPSGSLVSVEAGSLTAAGDLVNLGAGSTLNLSGPVLDMSGGSVTLGGSVLKADTSTLNLSTSAPLLAISNGASLTAGHLLELTNSPLDLGAQALVALTGESTLTNTVGPVIKISGGSLTADSLGKSDGTGNVFNLTGSFLDLTSTTVTLRTLGEVPVGEGGDVFHLSLALNEPVFRLSNSTLTLTGLDESLAGLGDITGSATPGVGLIATAGSTINLKGDLLDVVGSFQGTATEALLQLSNTTVNQTEATNALVDFDLNGMANTMMGPLAKISDSTIAASGQGFRFRAGSLTSNTTEPFIAIDPSNITTAGNFISLTDEGWPFNLTLNGSLVSDVGGQYELGGSFLRVRNGSSLTTTNDVPLLEFTNSTVNLNGNLFNLGSGPGQPGSTVSLAGALLNATNSAFDTGPNTNFVTVSDGATFTSTTNDALITMSGGTITTNQLARIGLGASATQTPTGSQAPVNMTLAGPLLIGTDTDITANSSVLVIRDRATFKSMTTSPLIQLGGISGSTLTLDGPGQVYRSLLTVQPYLTTPYSATAELAGPVLSGTNSAISTTEVILAVLGANGVSATLTSTTADPVVDLSGGSVTMAGTYPSSPSTGGATTDTSGSFLRMSSPDPDNKATLTLEGPDAETPAGPLLRASGTTFDGHNHFLRIDNNAQITSTGSDALVQLADTNVSIHGQETFTPAGEGLPTVTTFGDFLRVNGAGASLTLNGPLVSDSGSTFYIDGQFLRMRDASVLQATTEMPLIQFSNTQATAAGNFLNLSVNAPKVTLNGGALLSATSNSILTNGDPTANNYSFIFVGDSAELTSTSTSPLLSFGNSSVDTAGNILTLRRSNSETAPSKVTLSGPLFSATNNSSFNTTSLGGSDGAACCSGFFIGQGARLESTNPLADPSALVQLTNSNFNAGPDSQSGGTFFTATDGGASPSESNSLVSPSSVTLERPLLHATDSSISALYSLLSVTRSTLTSITQDPLIIFDGNPGSTLTLGGTNPITHSPTVGDVVSIVGSSPTPPNVSLRGPLLSSTNSNITATGRLVSISSGGQLLSTTTDPLITLSGGTLTLGGPLLTLSSGASLTAGRLLELTNLPPLDLGAQPLVALTGGSTLTNTAGPLIKITGGSLTADALGRSDGTGNTFNLTGSFLDLTDTSVTLRVLGEVPTEGEDTVIQILAPGEPAIRMTNSNLTLTEPGAPLVSFGGDPDGVALIATNTGETPKTLSLAGPLLELGGVSLTDTAPQIQLSNMNIVQTGGNTLIVVDPGETATLSGPLVSATGSNFDLTAAGRFLVVRDGASLNYTPAPPTPPALLQFTNTSVNTNGALFNLGSGPEQPSSTVTLAGPLLNASSSAFDSGPLSSFISVNDGATFTSTTEDPLLALSGGSITTKGHLVRIGLGSEYNPPGSNQSLPTGSQAPVNVTLHGPLLSATDAAITATYSVLNVRDKATFTSNTTAPLIQLLGTTPCSGETLCTSTLTLGGPDPDPTSPAPGQQINGRVFDVSSGLTAAFPVPDQLSAELFGPVLSATNTSIFTTDRILGVSGQNGASATLTSHTTAPLVQLTGGSVTMSGVYYPPTLNDSGKTEDTSGRFLSMSSPDPDKKATLTLEGRDEETRAGPLLYASGTTFEGHNHFLRIDNNAQVTSNGNDALVQLFNTNVSINGQETFTPVEERSPTVTAFGDFLRLNGAGASITLNGSFLSDSGSTFNIAGHFVHLQNAATMTLFGGGLLSATNTILTNGDAASNTTSFIGIHDSSQLNSTSTLPLLSFDSSSVNTSGNILSLRRSNSAETPSALTISGPLFTATNGSSFTTFTSAYPGGGTCCDGFFVGQAGHLESTNPTELPHPPALVQLTNSTFTPGSNFFQISNTGAFPGETNTLVSPSTVSLERPLLSATDSTITAPLRLLRVDRSTLTSTSGDPLIQLSGGAGRYEFGSGTGSLAGSLIDLRGANTDGTGLGADRVLQTGGVVFQATDNATVNLSGNGNAIRLDTVKLDTALLAASAPIVNLINSTLNTTSSVSSTGAMQVYQSSVTSNGPVFGLDHSILTVQYGPLLSLTGGSNMTVNGDFASLVNGSKITVLNGPLIYVAGQNPTSGAPSTLTINGALVNFASGTGNQVIINNSIASNVPLENTVGIPVNQQGTGSVVSITNPTPIKNQANGTLTVCPGPCAAGTINTAASVIQATGGGKVFVKP